MLHQQSEPAAGMRPGGTRARKSEHRIATGHATSDGRRLLAEFILRRCVGIALVDRGQQTNAVGELARNAVFHGLAGADALHDEVCALEGMERERADILGVAADGDVAAVLPAERFGARLARRAVAQNVEAYVRFLAEKRLAVGQDRRAGRDAAGQEGEACERKPERKQMWRTTCAPR